jgi:hypothetical protein
VIPEYAEKLASELAFDPPLARRVRREVEDHLLEAVSADRGCDRTEAERRAIASFGEPRAIAAQFAVGSLARQARRAGAAGSLLVAAVFVAMKARLAWYNVVQCPAIDGFEEASRIVVSIDRCAFWLAGIAATAAWIYIDSRRIPAALTAEYRAQLRRFIALGRAAVGLLVASVASDAFLTSLRLIATGWSVESLVPVFSLAIEAACVALMVSYFLGLPRRAAVTPG